MCVLFFFLFFFSSWFPLSFLSFFSLLFLVLFSFFCQIKNSGPWVKHLPFPDVNLLFVVWNKVMNWFGKDSIIQKKRTNLSKTPAPCFRCFTQGPTRDIGYEKKSLKTYQASTSCSSCATRYIGCRELHENCVASYDVLFSYVKSCIRTVSRVMT